jgi:prevent-host-death family protein
MKLDSVLSASTARSNFYSLLDEVSTKSRRFVITLRGGAKAVVISPEELEAWEETMEVMANSDLAGQIQKSEKERNAGKGVSESKLLRALGISAKDLK